MTDQFFQKSMDCTKNQGTLVSWIADSNNETKNPKFNMVDTKWRTFFQKSIDCAENRGISVFWVADFGNELHNS